MHYCGGYRYFESDVVHLFTECPEGQLIGIARRDPVNLATMEGLERCAWCFEKARTEER